MAQELKLNFYPKTYLKLQEQYILFVTMTKEISPLQALVYFSYNLQIWDFVERKSLFDRVMKMNEYFSERFYNIYPALARTAYGTNIFVCLCVCVYIQ